MPERAANLIKSMEINTQLITSWIIWSPVYTAIPCLLFWVIMSTWQLILYMNWNRSIKKHQWMVISTIALRWPLLRMKDQHACHHGPCMDSVYFLLPVAFTITNSADSEYTVNIIPEPSQRMYNYFTSIHPYFSPEGTVTHIKFSDFDDIENEKPEKKLPRWKNVFLFKYAHLLLSLVRPSLPI